MNNNLFYNKELIVQGWAVQKLVNFNLGLRENPSSISSLRKGKQFF